MVKGFDCRSTKKRLRWGGVRFAIVPSLNKVRLDRIVWQGFRIWGGAKQPMALVFLSNHIAD